MVRPSLNDLAAFTAVAGHLSFRRAADVMGVSRSALSHTIIGLEGKLGIRLFDRTTRRVSLTQAGARMLARLPPVLQDLDQALDALSEERGTPTGTLRINANKSGARILLRHVVPPFLDRYPDVELDLVSEGRLIDVVEQGFDAGVRLMETIPQDMVSDTRIRWRSGMKPASSSAASTAWRSVACFLGRACSRHAREVRKPPSLASPTCCGAGAGR